MAMQQPIPPEQQPQTVDVQQTAPTEAAVVPTDTVVTETPVDVVTTDTVPADVAPVDTTEQIDTAAVEPVETPEAADNVTQEQVDNAAIETVESALQEDEITAEDIMAAILTETLGVSDSAARSLFNLLLQDTVEEVAEATDNIAEVDTTEAATDEDINAAVEVQDEASKKENE